MIFFFNIGKRANWPCTVQCAYPQVIAMVPWTPARCSSNTDLRLIHTDLYIGALIYIWLAVGNWPTKSSLPTVFPAILELYTIMQSPLATVVESLLESPPPDTRHLQHTTHHPPHTAVPIIPDWRLPVAGICNWSSIWIEHVAAHQWEVEYSTGIFWLMEYSEFVQALANGSL
jgi:hypothetical protein